MKKQAKEWLYHSEIDLLSAQKLLDDEYLTQSTAFHCHQSIEKALKALVENTNVRVPKIHDLQKLYGILKEQNISVEVDPDRLDNLNSVYIDTRYPTDQSLVSEGKPSLKTVRAFYDYAKEIFKSVKEALEE
jgi:HEPN domain-containing protein